MVPTGTKVLVNVSNTNLQGSGEIVEHLGKLEEVDGDCYKVKVEDRLLRLNQEHGAVKEHDGCFHLHDGEFEVVNGQ